MHMIPERVLSMVLADRRIPTLPSTGILNSYLSNLLLNRLSTPNSRTAPNYSDSVLYSKKF